jgi:hypothetical protein
MEGAIGKLIIANLDILIVTTIVLFRKKDIVDADLLYLIAYVVA